MKNEKTNVMIDVEMENLLREMGPIDETQTSGCGDCDACKWYELCDKPEREVL